jgi:DMSO/TMAO reductase YedYZ molybdopterin-dependent catalytic subunit
MAAILPHTLPGDATDPHPHRHRIAIMATPSRIPAPAAALAGLLAVAGALSAGHLVAGLLTSPAASPFLAVGNAAIDRTPTAVKDFAIDKFGTNDKPALLMGMAVVLALVGILIGLVSRRSALPGLIAIGVIGVVGILAVREQSTSTLDILAPIVSLLVGLAVFWFLHAWPRPRPTADHADADEDEAASGQRRPFRRRRFLIGSVGAAVGTAVAGVAGFALAGRVDVAASRRAIGALTPTEPAPPIPPNAAFPELGTPTFLTPSADFYRIDINLTVPQVLAEDAVLRIKGMVDRPVEFTFDDIRRMPLVEKTITMTCVSNPVGGPYVSTSNFLGVPLSALLERAGVRPEATQLVGRSVDGFTLGTPLEAIRDAGDNALLAIGMNREPLLPEHGFPMRTVVPGLYGYVSATKWVTELELTTYDFKPYWVQRGWDGQPPGIVPIKISSRVDAPSSFERVAGGQVTVAGTAWAQGRGVSRVEVRFDEGEWEPAELAAEVNPNTWRMFRLTKQLPPGQHQVASRAFDGEGNMQSEERMGINTPGPAPDGSTGWHSIIFTVE